jgi:membrane-associated protease RseP (regulator of RpoE activity)
MSHSEINDGQPESGDHDHGHKRSPLALVILGALVAFALVTGNALTLVLVLCILLIVVIHEGGHLLAAKLTGMKATEFFVGFGQRLWSTKRGETEYGLKAIPAGGYVRIVGMNNLEEVDPQDESRSYRQASYPRRFLVGIAGCLTHFVTSFLIAFALLAFVGLYQPTTQVAEVSSPGGEPSPAQAAGIQVGDSIVSLDGQAIEEWEAVPAYVEPRTGESIEFGIERGGQRLNLEVVPVDRNELGAQYESQNASSDGTIGFIGVRPDAIQVKEPIGSAIVGAGERVVNTSVAIVQSFADIFSPSGISSYLEQFGRIGDDPADQSAGADAQAVAQNEDRFVSPVGLVRFADDAVDSGLVQALTFLFAFNLFVGILNLVPLPPFDGAHVAVATYERLRSRKGKRHIVDYSKLLPVLYAVLAVLGFIFVSALALDILDPLPNLYE